MTHISETLQKVVAHICTDAALIWYIYAFLLGNENEITVKLLQNYVDFMLLDYVTSYKSGTQKSRLVKP